MDLPASLPNLFSSCLYIFDFSIFFRNGYRARHIRSRLSENSGEMLSTVDGALTQSISDVQLSLPDNHWALGRLVLLVSLLPFEYK
jgi:hypothetical protein